MLDLLPTRQIAITIGSFSIHWYGVLYLVAFAQAYLLLPRLQKHTGLNLSRDTWLEIVAWGAAAVVIGGRLGYVLFYEPGYYLAHPTESIMLGSGGMSAHGGLLAVGTTLFFVARAKRINPLRLFDSITIVAGIGLALGRFGNFINQELYGPATTLPWGAPLPDQPGRYHPTPLYAALKDLTIAGLSYVHLRWHPAAKPGQTTALFLILYSLGRFFLEYLRVQQFPVIDLGPITLTYGQLLTIPVLLGGVIFYLWLNRQPSPTPPS